MRHFISLSLVIASALSVLPPAQSAPAHKASTAPKSATASKTAPASKASAPSQPEVRHFDFPTDYPVGALKLMGVERIGSDNMGRGIGPARGKVTVVVPLDSTIELDINPHFLEQPDKLKTLHTAGIDRLKIAYMAMEDSAHAVCDTGMAALPVFKDLVALHLDRSDVTDIGLLGFKSMPSVKYLYCSGAAIEGPAFKNADHFKSLEILNLIFNPFKYENLKYLSALPHLTELVLNQSNLSDTDVGYLSKCTQIKRLHLQDNKRVTDKSLPTLRALSGLEVINIRGTNISFDGALTLNTLKLKKLYLTVRRYRPDEIEKVKKAFPKTFVSYRGQDVDEESKVYFAPLK